MRLRVRLATFEDRAAIVALVAAMGLHDDVAERAEPLVTLRALLATPGARTLVAERDGAITGVAAFEARTDLLADRKEAWLSLLAVAPAERSLGIGAALLDEVERQAEGLGCAAIVLESSLERERAHAFYHAGGFSESRPARRFERLVAPRDGTLPERFLAAAARAATRVTVAIAGERVAAAVGLGADGAPTEAADDAAERAACLELATLGVPIVSEEAGLIASQEGAPGGAAIDAAQPWISLDPLDGSRNFIAGYPPHAMSAALVCAGRPLAGFVVDFVSGNRWTALAGHGATRDSAAIATRHSGLAAMPSPLPGRVRPREFPGMSRVRTSGSTATELCRVADGALAAFFALDRAVVHVHDLAAALVIIQEAGGCVIDRTGATPVLVPDATTCFEVVAACDERTARDLVALG